MDASVFADAVRPTGPAATVASPPSVNLVDSRRSMPFLSITSITISLSLPPIWKPTLPASAFTAAGADHPLAVRHDAKPRPYSPPTMNAPDLSEGMTMTHWAFFSRSAGISLSAAFDRLLSVSTASASRSGVSAHATPGRICTRAAQAIAINALRNFMNVFLRRY